MPISLGIGLRTTQGGGRAASLLNLSSSNVDTLSPTFTRASAAYETDSVGVLASRAVDVLRSSHYIGAERTFLLEGQRTNKQTFAEQLDNAVWSKTLCAITANATTAPDDTATADLVTNDGTAGQHYIKGNALTATTGSSTWSAFVKKGTCRYVHLLMETDNHYAQFDLDTGALVHSGGVGVTHGIEDVGDYYRVRVSGANTGGARGCRLYFLDAAQNIADPAETSSGTGYAWGLQLEDAPSPSSYIKTEAATVSRAVDSCPLDFPHAPQEMTVYCRFRELGTADSNGWIFQLADPGSVHSMPLDATGGFYRLRHFGTSGSSASTLGVAPAIGDLVELRGILNTDGSVQIHQSINGAAEVAAAAGSASPLAAAWNENRLYIGYNKTGNHGFNAFRNVLILRGTKTLDDCRARVEA